MNCKLLYRYYQINTLTKNTEFTNTSRSLTNSVEKMEALHRWWQCILLQLAMMEKREQKFLKTI